MVKDGGESSRGPVGLSTEGPMGNPGSRGRGSHQDAWQRPVSYWEDPKSADLG